MFMKDHVTKQARHAKEASRKLAWIPVEVRNKALLAMAEALEARQEEILEVNAKEVEASKAKTTRPNMIDRLILTPKRIAGMAEGIRQVVALEDPIGKLDFEVVRPNGLKIRRVRVPFGVVGIVYEARPNVTADAIALCIKSGNACLLRGGSEAVRTNKKIVDIMREAAVANGLPERSIEFIAILDRDAVVVMCRLRKLVDVIIPRGGVGLITRVVEHSTVPVIETGTGICHTFVDKTADQDMAIKICVNHSPRDFRQEFFGNVLVNQERFHCVADGRARGLGVYANFNRHVLVGGLVHERVANAGAGFDNGNGAVLHDACDKSCAAARNNHVDKLAQPAHDDNRIAVEDTDKLNRR